MTSIKHPLIKNIFPGILKILHEYFKRGLTSFMEPDHEELGCVLTALGGPNRKSKGIMDLLDILGFG